MKAPRQVIHISEAGKLTADANDPATVATVDAASGAVTVTPAPEWRVKTVVMTLTMTRRRAARSRTPPEPAT